VADTRAEPVNAHRRSMLRANLIASGMDAQTADLWIKAWRDEATRHHFEPSGREYWQAAGRWIGKKRPLPPRGARRTDRGPEGMRGTSRAI
jgi:hypothetical protein